MSQKETGRAGNSADLETTNLNTFNDTADIKQKPDVSQAEFSTITCRTVRAAALRECLKYEMLRVITAATTASAYLADENDAAAIEAMRRLWPIMKTGIAIPAAELDRLGGTP
jgi:hypothetical protein